MILSLLEKNLVPDAAIRLGIRNLLAERAKELTEGGIDAAKKRTEDLRQRLWNGPVAEATKDANEQHYEVPTEFFLQILGPWRKYSSCLYPEPNTTLLGAEEAMLQRTCDLADLQPGHRVLDLGCGWGSFTLYAATHYPQCQFVGVSNSATQREFIMAEAARRGLTNVEILTHDIVDFEPTGPLFDRVVSVEMMEHVRNHLELFRRLGRWTKPDARMFVHIFVHHTWPYLFEVDPNAPPSPGDWMSRYFFTGGMMPSFQWLPEAAQSSECWQTVHKEALNGNHYSKTLEAWLRRMDAAPDQIKPILGQTYGPKEIIRWWVRWRVFFMACSELFRYNNGNEWQVAHYVFERKHP
jgi:cyclopropane-fatty-acyl-phospholipid synthase